jgi:uncharacterized protein YjlB
MVSSPPETYYVTQPTLHVPNSPLPVLVYRSALPSNPTAASIRELLEPNDWIQGGVFKHYPAHHFHSVTHECYAVFKGKSRLLLGKGPLDLGKGCNDEGSVDTEVVLGVGDVIVLPAGVAHCCLESEDGYEYVGLYPKVCTEQIHTAFQFLALYFFEPMSENDTLYYSGQLCIRTWPVDAQLHYLWSKCTLWTMDPYGGECLTFAIMEALIPMTSGEH